MHILGYIHAINSVAFSSNAAWIAIVCYGYARIFDIRTDAKITTLIEDDDLIDRNVLTICFDPDAKWLEMRTTDSIIRIWNITTNTILKHVLGHNSSISFMNCSSKYLASTSYDDMVKL